MRNDELIKYRGVVLESLKNHDYDKNKPFIVSNGKTYTINDIIKEVEELSDFGIKQIRYWVNTQERIKQVLKKN